MNTQNDNIDALLHAWGQRQTASEEQLTRLRKTVLQQARQSPVRQREHWWGNTKPYPRLVAGLAALAAVAVVCCLVGIYGARKGMESEPTVAAPRTLTLDDIRRHTALLETVQELFADQWRWVAQFNGDIELEVHPLSGGVTDRSQPVLMRLTMLSRTDSETGWSKAWETEVMMRSDELLDLPIASAAGSHLQLWIYPLGDGNLAVDTGIELTGRVKAQSRESHLVPEGKPVEIMALRSHGTEYRVFQEIRLLKLSDGC